MHRTAEDDWQTVYKRIRTGSRPGMGGVLVAARRQHQERVIRAVAILLVCSLLSCLGAFAGVQRALAGRPTPVIAVAESSVTPTPTPLVIPDEYQHPFNILLLGSDQRGEDRSFRTDVIVLVSIDPVERTASAVSFPRDLWVEPPSLYPMKLNMIQAIGGFDVLAETFEYSFGIRPDYYVLVNFSGFTHLIDGLGGIDVRISQSLTDSCDLPQEPDGICTVEPGITHMDGPTALWYARSRYSSSDYDRLRRAQEVVQAVFERMMHLDALANLPQVYGAVAQDVETNLTLGDFAPLAPLAIPLFTEPDRIHRFVIDENQATPSYSWDGMWILLPDLDAIRAVLEQAGIRQP